MVKELVCTLLLPCTGFTQPGSYHSHHQTEHQIIFESKSGERLRLQFYKDYIIRFHWVRAGESFFSDDHYKMVEKHERTGQYTMEEQDNSFLISTGPEQTLQITLLKTPMKFYISIPTERQMLLAEKEGIQWQENTINCSFLADPREHFCGLGHEAYGWVESLDLQGKTVSCNYGEGTITDWGAQGVLTVPFYLSNKGYGVFLNSTYHHEFNFGENGMYEFEIDTKGFRGQMDFFFIYGPHFPDILDHYTWLTGRPRLPQRSIFGLQLSDKGNPEHRGTEWWKDKINAHREAGFPFDHITFDNRWRAGSGAWSGSWFEWDSTRCADPAAFQDWCQANNVTVTLDLNRNNTALCKGWKPEYNLPYAEESGVKYGSSAPDYSNPEMRNWLWEMFWNQSLDPALGYPGDGLWIDETDELFPLYDTVICANGRSWAENENYYPFLIAKAIVQEGWDNENNNEPPGIGEAKRPFVWMRSMCAGAQRFASHWNGDIDCDCEWMKTTIRAMLSSGLSGFPYFNHDAGGFRHPGPEDYMYIQWSMAMGSLSPVWRPHGIGTFKRWPLDRSAACQESAHTYGKMRYEMMPYIYTWAYRAHETGLPMARPMVINYQDSPEAWEYDLQYLWGDALLVAPVCSRKDTTVEVWLPVGQPWYDYWTGQKFEGGQVIRHTASVDQIPLFVKAGAIIPRHPYAQSTFVLDPAELILDVYTGHDGKFELYEDDGVTEHFRTRNEKRTTLIEYRDAGRKLIIHPAEGTFEGANAKRRYTVHFHGLAGSLEMEIDGRKIEQYTFKDDLDKSGAGAYWHKEKEILTVRLGEYQIRRKIELKRR